MDTALPPHLPGHSSTPPHVSKCDNSLICQEQRRVRRARLWENFGSRHTDASSHFLSIFSFFFFSSICLFFVPKAPFVKSSYVIVVTFKPEKVSCLMANSIQCYYPQIILRQFFHTTSSMCWVIFISVCACIHFVSILHSCGLFTSQRTPCTQTWCKQKSLINFT